jgi:His/Glu/Gln/Arg/opine family amino acid ABC transporter permease subunit
VIHSTRAAALERPLVFDLPPMKVLAAFDWSFIWENRAEIWSGLKNTLRAAVVGIVGSFLIGVVLGAARAHRIPVVSQVAGIYVELIRNTPILVQIFLLYYGILPWLGYTGSPFLAAWLSITIWGGAFNTENFRAGFEAVPRRFREAAYALGLTPLKTFLNVTLPIGGRIALPSSINTYISVLKNTSLLLVIGYAELTSVANHIQSVTFRTFEMFAVIAVIYLALVWTLSALVRLLETRLALPESR